MVNFGKLAAEIISLVWGIPANFNGFRVLLRYCSDVAHRRPTKLARCLPVSWAGTLQTFSTALALDTVLPGAINLPTVWC